MHRCFVVDGNHQIREMVMRKKDFIATPILAGADVVIFPGGPDVNPSLYGEEKHPTTHFWDERDALFQKVYNLVKRPDTLKIGICGGGQFLNVMNGGKMFQDVDSHARAGEHSMWYSPYPNAEGCYLDGSRWQVTSTHHQMMIGNPDTAELWGWAKESTARARGSQLHVLRKNSEVDTEILWYPQSSCLCFQPHPEYTHANETEEVFWKCVQTAIQRNKIKGS